MWLINYGERTSTSPFAFGYPLLLSSPWSLPSPTACRIPALVFCAVNRFAMKRSAPCSAVLRYSLSSWAAVIHWSALMLKAIGSSRKHPIHSFSWSPKQPAPPTDARTSNTPAVSYRPCAPQTPQIRSASSCVKWPRCSHFPSW